MHASFIKDGDQRLRICATTLVSAARSAYLFLLTPRPCPAPLSSPQATAMGPQHDTSTLGQALAEPLLGEWQSRASKAKSAAFYWSYKCGPGGAGRHSAADRARTPGPSFALSCPARAEQMGRESGKEARLPAAWLLTDTATRSLPVRPSARRPQAARRQGRAHAGRRLPRVPRGG